MTRTTDPLADLLARHRPRDAAETADTARVAELLATSANPWARTTPLHVTASALVVHPPTRRVLLRWHARQRAWLQVGGHGDPGETDPVEVALREAREETGLADLVPWPSADLVHVVVVPVTANAVEPEHEHADLRFVLATDRPEDARPEKPDAPLRWLALDDAHATVGEANVRETLSRIVDLLRPAR